MRANVRRLRESLARYGSAEDHHIAKQTTKRTYQIEKEWDGNEAVREVNHRIYVSRGRWRWVVLVDGEVCETFATRRDAKDYAVKMFPDATLLK